MGADMEYFFAQHIKNRPVPLIHHLVATDKNRQTAQGRKVHRIGDGRF